MKTEYRAAYFGRASLPESLIADGGPTDATITFKPWVQTVSTSLVYRFNSGGASAFAGDPPERTFMKAPAPVAAPNWTGFYVFGGGGGGMWDADNDASNAAESGSTRDQHLGGRGWFGAVGAGYDWLLGGSWVTGVFAEGMFGAINGTISDPFFQVEGTEKLRTAWAAGARAGYLVAPSVLSYVNAGYTASEWSGASLTPLFTTPSFHLDGWFVGGGVENSLNIFGISAPGWNMKTEYRAAYFGRATLTEQVGGSIIGETVTFKPLVQTISTSLVYRFNSEATTKY
jgi:outer membrane immunogenic protein